MTLLRNRLKHLIKKESFFTTCDRDDKGHCVEGTGDHSGSAPEAGKPDNNLPNHYAGKELEHKPDPYTLNEKRIKTTEGAEKEFKLAIKRQYPIRIPLFHEAPIAALDSIMKNGLTSHESTGDSENPENYFTIGKPSQFVISKDKVIVQTSLPSKDHVIDKLRPDMRYDPANPKGDLLKEHKGVYGADVANEGTVRPDQIDSIHVVRDGKIVKNLKWSFKDKMFVEA